MNKPKDKEEPKTKITSENFMLFKIDEVVRDIYIKIQTLDKKIDKK
jgi:hypothetical protein